MSTNSQLLIEQVIRDEHLANKNYSSEDSFFEFYTSNQILRDYDLTYDEIESGICGSSLDGGADSIYLFVNGELIQEEIKADDKFKKNVEIELFIIQSKNERSFNEDPILKLSRLSKNLLSLDFKIEDYKNRYNEIVIGKFDLFRKTYLRLVTKRPSLKISYYYATKGVDVHPNVSKQIKDLTSEVMSVLTESEVSFHTIGANELLEIFRKKSNEVFSLKLAENPLSSQGKVFISLVNLLDYYDFITDEDNNIIRHIFEANVRDYQGRTNVNHDINQTLLNGHIKEDFWWLNNGVTILASDVSAPGGKELIVHNPEIVNGLQTSNEIYNFFKSNRIEKESRSILVRVIVPEDEESRDKIIRATNSQTPIPKASLRGTDPIHRDIEDHFKPRGLFYDRRKNFYKNEGKKPADIVSLPFLAQCVMAITMQKPDFARARPSTLLEEDVSYNKLYSKTNDVRSYYIAAVIGKRVDSFLKTIETLSISDKNNIKFFLIYTTSAIVCKNIHPGFRALSEINQNEITPKEIEESYEIVIQLYVKLGGGDKLAKGQELTRVLKEQLKNCIN